MERIFVLDREQLAARPFSAIPRVDAPSNAPPNASQPGSRTASKATATCMAKLIILAATSRSWPHYHRFRVNHMFTTFSRGHQAQNIYCWKIEK